MKNKYLLLFGLICFLIIGSCNKAKHDDILTFDYQDETKLSDIISDIEYIRLETNDFCQIGSIQQLLKYNNHYYILDAHSSKSIFMFDEDGNYIKHIERIGQGPGEYIMPYFMAICESNSTLIIIDFIQFKMLVFDANTFEFIEENMMETESLNFCFLNNKNDIAWYNMIDITHKNETYPFHLITTKSDGSFINKMIPIDFNSGYILNPFSPFFQTDTSVLFSHPYHGIVYKISSDKAEEVFKLNFKKHLFPSTNYLKGIKKQNDFLQRIRQSDYINFFNTFESEQHYCFVFYASNTYFMALHSKVSNKNIYYPVSIVENNAMNCVIKDNNGLLYYNTPITCIDNSYYSIIQPFHIIENRKKYSDNLHPQLQQIMNMINDDDNPIILKYKLCFN